MSLLSNNEIIHKISSVMIERLNISINEYNIFIESLIRYLSNSLLYEYYDKFIIYEYTYDFNYDDEFLQKLTDNQKFIFPIYVQLLELNKTFNIKLSTYDYQLTELHCYLLSVVNISSILKHIFMNKLTLKLSENSTSLHNTVIKFYIYNKLCNNDPSFEDQFIYKKINNLFIDNIVKKLNINENTFMCYNNYNSDNCNYLSKELFYIYIALTQSNMDTSYEQFKINLYSINIINLDDSYDLENVDKDYYFTKPITFCLWRHYIYLIDLNFNSKLIRNIHNITYDYDKCYKELCPY